jgi:hypothetical protein
MICQRSCRQKRIVHRVLLSVRSTWLKHTPAKETRTESSSGHDQSGTRFYRVMRKSGADSYAPEQLH